MVDRPFVILLSVVLLATVSDSVARSEPGETNFTRIPDAAKANWERFAHLKDNIVLDGLVAQRSLDGSANTFHLKLTVQGQHACMEQRNVNPKTGQEDGLVWVICRGPQCSFVLERKRKDAPFIVKAMTEQGQEEPGSYFQLLDYFLSIICEEPYHAAAKVASRVGDGSTSLETSDQVGPGNRPLVALSYSYQDPGNRPTKGTIRLDPALNWAIVSYDEHQPDPGEKPKYVNTTTAKISYVNRDGKLLADKVSETANSHPPEVVQSGPIQTTDWTLTDVSFAPISDAAFSFTAFGLPDISARAKTELAFFSTKNWAMWASLGVALVSAGLLWKITRHKVRA